MMDVSLSENKRKRMEYASVKETGWQRLPLPLFQTEIIVCNQNCDCEEARLRRGFGIGFDVSRLMVIRVNILSILPSIDLCISAYLSLIFCYTSSENNRLKRSDNVSLLF